MALSAADFKTNIEQYKAYVPSSSDTPAARLISILDSSELLLFQGKDEIQPIKIYQIKRIYALAKICIELITLLWPYLKVILNLLKKIF